MDWGTVVVAVVGSLTTLAAGLGAPLVNGRLQRDRWRTERRSALYIELVADALQRRGLEEDWADTYPAKEGDVPLRRRDWDVFGPREIVTRLATIRVFGEPSMLAAWEAYASALDRVSWSGEVNGERDSAAEEDLDRAIDAVLEAGRRHGVP
jgi:hypothetical protein